MEVPAAAAVAAAAAERAARARSIAWLRARCDAALSSFCGVSFVRACSPSRRARGALAACACELVAPSATIGALAAYESETTRTETDRTDGDAHRAPSLRLVPPLGAPVAECGSHAVAACLFCRVSLSRVSRDAKITRNLRAHVAATDCLDRRERRTGGRRALSVRARGRCDLRTLARVRARCPCVQSAATRRRRTRQIRAQVHMRRASSARSAPPCAPSRPQISEGIPSLMGNRFEVSGQTRCLCAGAHPAA